jgi:hypothetical protein
MLGGTDGKDKYRVDKTESFPVCALGGITFQKEIDEEQKRKETNSKLHSMLGEMGKKRLTGQINIIKRGLGNGIQRKLNDMCVKVGEGESLNQKVYPFVRPRFRVDRFMGGVGSTTVAVVGDDVGSVVFFRLSDAFAKDGVFWVEEDPAAALDDDGVACCGVVLCCFCGESGGFCGVAGCICCCCCCCSICCCCCCWCCCCAWLLGAFGAVPGYSVTAGVETTPLMA